MSQKPPVYDPDDEEEEDEDELNPKPRPPAPVEKKRRFSRRALIIGAVVLIFICGGIGSLLPDDAADQTEQTAEAGAEVVATEEPSPTEQPTDTPRPTEPPAPTDTPVPPTATLEPAAALLAAVADALGTSNRDVERLVRVEDENGRIEVDWAINDNLSEDLTRGGAQLDAAEILEAIVASGYEYEFILLRGTFPLVDQFGNVEETKVVELFFERPTVERINFDNFSHRNVYDIADSSQIHPAFVRE